MSKTLLAALSLITIGQILAFSAGFLGLTQRAGWMLVVGTLVQFVALLGYSTSAYGAGRRDSVEDEFEEMMGE